MFSFLFDLKRTAVLLCCAPMFVGAGQEVYRLVEGRFTGADLAKVIPPGLDGQLAAAGKTAAQLEQHKPALAALVCVPDRPPEAVAVKTSDDDLLKTCKRRTVYLADLKLLFRAYTDLHLLRNETQVGAYKNPDLLGKGDLIGFVEKFKELVRGELHLKSLARAALPLTDRQLPDHLKEWAAELKQHEAKEGANEDFCRVQTALIFKHRFRLDHKPAEFLGRARGKFEADAPDPLFAEEIRKTIADLEQKLKDLRGAPDGEDVKDMRSDFTAWLRDRKRVQLLFGVRERAAALAARAKPGDEAAALLAELAALAGEKEFEPYRPLALGAARHFLERFLPAPLPPDPQVMLKDLNGKEHGPVPRETVIVYWTQNGKDRSAPLKKDPEAQKKFSEFDARLWMSLERPSIYAGGREYQGVLLPTARATAHHEYNRLRAADWRWGRASLGALIEGLEARAPRSARRLHEEMDQELWARIRWLRDNFPEALTQRTP